VRVGVLGSANVGQAFARAFRSRGHDVMIGSREPAKLEEFVRGPSKRKRRSRRQ